MAGAAHDLKGWTMAASGQEFSGRMRERVRIEQRVYDGDGNGGPGNGWESVGTAWAMVEPMARTTGAAVQADTRLTSRTWRVTMRSEYRVLLDMRLVWRGGLLRVSRVEPDPAMPDRTVVLAEEFGP